MTAADAGLKPYYSARAEEYDSVYRKPERQADLRALEQWLPGLFIGQTVLEVACGTGYWTQFIAPVAAAVVAIDAAPETLRLAERRMVAPHVEFRLGDAYALPAQRPPFDAAFAGFWFSHVPIERQHEFLAGLDAALAPGARVVLLDNRFVDGNSSPIVEQDSGGNTYQLRTLADGSQHRILKNFPSEGGLRDLARARGASAAAFHVWPYFWAFEYRVARP